LMDKLRRHPGYVSLDDVKDKCGVRVVTRYEADIQAVCDLLKGEFVVLEDESHGQESVEAFGYTGRHLVVRLSTPRAELREWKSAAGLVAEIQIRSILQHAWASISHGLDYKTGVDVPAKARRRLFRVAALLETGDELFDTFRSEVAKIRAGYRAEVASPAWREVPVDVDGVEEAWAKLPIQGIYEAAVAAGWSSLPKTVWSQFVDPYPREAISILVQAASNIGYVNVGQLADSLEGIVKNPEPLARIRAECLRQDSGTAMPHAVATDAIVMYWMVSRGAERVWGQGHEPYIPELMRAVRAAHSASGAEAAS
jgi:Region found in RelA / SpoT proteins